MPVNLLRGARLIHADDLAVCNCAGCRCLLHGENQAAAFAAGTLKTLATIPPRVAKRVNDRPLCGKCIARYGMAA